MTSITRAAFLQSLCIGMACLLAWPATAQEAGVKTGQISAAPLAPIARPASPVTKPVAAAVPIIKPVIEAKPTPALPLAEKPAGGMAAPMAQMAPQKTMNIGLLAPLSGESAGIGKAMIDAATLGLYDLEASYGKQANGALKLVIKDTKGTAEGAKQAAVEALQDGAEIIIGPLTDVETQLLGPVLQSTKKWAFSLSHNPIIRVPNVVQCGYFSGQQIERLLTYAFKRGANRIATIARNSVEGRMAMDEFAQSMGRRGVTPLATVTTGSDNANMTREIGPLVADISKITRQSGVGLFLPISAPDTEQVLRFMVEKNRIPRNYLLVFGTNQWDTSEALNQFTMQEAVFTSTPPEKFTQFTRRFEGSYEYPAPRVASLAYDLVVLFGRLIGEGGLSALTPEIWQDENGFVGPANGLFRIRNNHVCERNYAILKTDGRGKKEILDPASPVFAKAE